MNAFQIELEFHRVIFAHHYGYRPVAASEGIPAGVVEALEASRHHLYFLERRKDEKFRPIKYRFFRLRTENEEFAVWAKLEAAPDVTTHRGLVSTAQFYLLGSREKDKFESELRANAAEVMAKIPFAAIQLGSELRRDERKQLAPLKLTFAAPEPAAKQLQRLRASSKADGRVLQNLLSEEVIEAIETGKKIFFHSVGFTDFTDIFNVYCRSLFTALPEAYRQSLSFATAEFTANVEDYDLVFLHGAAELDLQQTRDDVKLFSLDRQPSLWYLRGTESESPQSDAHRFLSERLVGRSLKMINALKDYYEFLTDPKGRTSADFKALLKKIEPGLVYLNGGVIATDLIGFVRSASADMKSYSPAIFASLQSAKEHGSKAGNELWNSPVQYITTWLDFLAGTEVNANVAGLIENFKREAKKDAFAQEVFTALSKSKTLQNIFPRQLIFSGSDVAPALTRDQIDADLDDAGKIREELLVNLGLKNAEARRLQVDGYSLSLHTPQFKLGFNGLEKGQQEAFFEYLSGCAKDAGAREGILLPVLCTYLKIARPNPENQEVVEKCFKDGLIAYLHGRLNGHCWNSDDVEKKTVNLCKDLKDIPCELNEGKKILSMRASGDKQYLSGLSYNECFMMIFAATQNQPERIDQLIPEFREMVKDDFIEMVELYLEYGLDKTPDDAERIKPLWREKTVRHSGSFKSKL